MLPILALTRLSRDLGVCLVREEFSLLTKGELKSKANRESVMSFHLAMLESLPRLGFSFDE